MRLLSDVIDGTPSGFISEIHGLIDSFDPDRLKTCGKRQSASSASAFDLLVDFGVDGIFITNSLVPSHRRSIGHRAVDPVAAAHSGAVRLADRTMATVTDTSTRASGTSGGVRGTRTIGTGWVRHLGRVAYP